MHPAGKCPQASCHGLCWDGCRVSLSLGKRQMARHPPRHPPSSLPWYRECPQALLSCATAQPSWAPQHLSSSQCHLLGRDTSVLDWEATGTSPGQGGVRSRDCSQPKPPLGQGRCTGEDKHSWEQNLPSPVPKASTGIAQQAEQFFHFLLQSAAGFDEMAAPTSSYEKTRPLEAGETWVPALGLGSCGTHSPLWQPAGKCVLWWDGALTCAGGQEKAAEL